MNRVLIVGASRGIGREFVRQHRAAGDAVLATHRRAEDAGALQALGAESLMLDVRDAEAVAALGRRLEADAHAGRPLDIAVLNAGVYGPRTTGATAVTDADFDAVMHTNVLGPMRLIAALAPALAASRGRLAVISSRMGSLGQIGGAGGWLYRASKSAVNMALRAAALELGPQGVVCLTLHPGWVRTDMGGAGADIDAPTSVAGLRAVIARAGPAEHGGFFNYDGSRIDW